jgi:hypothetical protein
MAKSKPSISRFVLEIFSIFLGVTIAFLANHWNEQMKERKVERKTLEEIRAGLKSDTNDILSNIGGHSLGLKSIDMFERYVHNEPVDYDSLGLFFRRLYSDYLSITNTTAYETLQSRGLEIISNDALRSEIVDVTTSPTKSSRSWKKNTTRLSFTKITLTMSLITSKTIS